MSKENDEDVLVCKCPCLANEEHGLRLVSPFQPWSTTPEFMLKLSCPGAIAWTCLEGRLWRRLYVLISKTFTAKDFSQILASTVLSIHIVIDALMHHPSLSYSFHGINTDWLKQKRCYLSWHASRRNLMRLKERRNITPPHQNQVVRRAFLVLHTLPISFYTHNQITSRGFFRRAPF